MHRPPRRAPRAANPASIRDRAAASAPASAPAGSAAAKADGVDRQRMIDEFEAALLEERDLGADEREAILRQYREALDIAPVELAPPNLDALRASFLQMTEAMAQDNVIESSEREGLVHKFYAAIEPLDSAEVRRSMEYARRVQAGGVEEAGAWLAAQSDTGSPAPAPAAEYAPTLAPVPRARRRR
jgi:hypothetical protein